MTDDEVAMYAMSLLVAGNETTRHLISGSVASLFEHLESDGSLDEFLENFPTVTRAAAVAVLMSAQELAIDKSRLRN